MLDSEYPGCIVYKRNTVYMHVRRARVCVCMYVFR